MQQDNKRGRWRRWLRVIERQTAWVMLFGAIPWGFLEPSRALMMAIFWTIGAFYLYMRSAHQTTIRTILLMFACLTLVYAGRVYGPYVPETPSLGPHMLRVLLELLVFNILGALNAITQWCLLPRWQRSGGPPAGMDG